jgi:hypothetical protein
MPRTLISLDADDKRWLDRYAHSRNLPMTEIVRQALREFRERHPVADTGFSIALMKTRGIGSGEDGLQYQERLRSEWNGKE